MNDCNCGDVYQNALCKIEEANKNVQYRAVQGPKGDKGDTGPAGPQGPIGPQGPQGEPGTPAIEAVGRIYSNSTTAIALQANTPTLVPLANMGPINGVSADNANVITITTAGDYRIDFFFYGSSNTAATIKVGVRQDEAYIGSTTISKVVTVNTPTTFYGSTINALPIGAKIGLGIESSVVSSITPNANTNAYINVSKL